MGRTTTLFLTRGIKLRSELAKFDGNIFKNICSDSETKTGAFGGQVYGKSLNKGKSGRRSGLPSWFNHPTLTE